MIAKIAPWYRSTFGMAALGSVLLWAALPPVDFWPLAWIAPIPWVMLIQSESLPALASEGPKWLQSLWGRRSLVALLIGWLLLALPLSAWYHSFQFEGCVLYEAIYWSAGLCVLLGLATVNRARPYITLWLVNFFFWLAVVQWLRLPHWATCIGWWALATYFAFYLPVFIAISRVAVHRWRVPAWIAAPIVWTGLEWARAHLLTGNSMASLAHTQYRWTELIQISDLVGAYGVSFLVMFVAACVERLLAAPNRPRNWLPATLAIAVMSIVLYYGHIRIAATPNEPGPRVALIQGAFDIQLGSEPGTGKKIQRDYLDRTWEALRPTNNAPIDLVIWPETIFSPIWVTSSRHPPKPEVWKDKSDEEFRAWLDDWVHGSRDALLDTSKAFGVPMIVGIDRDVLGDHGDVIFNSAVFIRPGRQEIEWYDKMHLVLFGEYTPFIDKLPWLQNLTPLCTSAHEGDRPADFMLNYNDHGMHREVCIAPNICYESVLPHLIREQIITLRAEGHDPEILVNLTNDGWFWGSNELEQHLACGVFRAVESRRPFLIAANTGISAWIDSCGRLRDAGPRRASTVIVADVELDHRPSFYIASGDWFAAGCLFIAIVVACIKMGSVRNMWRCENDRAIAGSP